MKLLELRDWYLDLPRVRELSDFDERARRFKHLVRLLGAESQIDQIDLNVIDDYIRTRLQEAVPQRPRHTTKPATVNRELAALRHMFRLATKRKMIAENPVDGVQLLRENNVRKRTLSKLEFERLWNASPDYLRPIILTNYFEPMRKEEVIGLDWSELHLNRPAPFIALPAHRTKNGEGRLIPLHPQVVQALEGLEYRRKQGQVFLRAGQEIKDCRAAFEGARQRAGLRDVVMHDLRRTAITNLLIAGNPALKVKLWSGHKTLKMLERYFVPGIEYLTEVKW